MEHPLNRRFAGLAGGDRIITHALLHLERVALLTAVLVDRHCFTKYSPGAWHSKGESAKPPASDHFLADRSHLGCGGRLLGDRLA